jgi:hypothetical protein
VQLRKSESEADAGSVSAYLGAHGPLLQNFLEAQWSGCVDALLNPRRASKEYFPLHQKLDILSDCAVTVDDRVVLMTHKASGTSDPDEFVSAHADEDRKPAKLRGEFNNRKLLEQEFS